MMHPAQGTLVHPVNRHTAELEPPDLVRLILRGPISPEEMAELGRIVQQWSKDLPYVLLIADISTFSHEGTSAESRRVAAEASLPIPYRGTAFCGGSALQRFVVNFMMRAVNLFTRRDNPIRFFETELQAHPWLDERRRALRAELAGGRRKQA